MEHGPVEIVDFPIKHGWIFPWQNGDFPINNGDFPIKNGDFPWQISSPGRVFSIKTPLKRNEATTVRHWDCYEVREQQLEQEREEAL